MVSDRSSDETMTRIHKLLDLIRETVGEQAATIITYKSLGLHSLVPDEEDLLNTYMKMFTDEMCLLKKELDNNTKPDV